MSAIEFKTPAPNGVNTLEDANKALQEVALDSFQKAFASAIAPDPSGGDPRKHAEWEASVAQAKSQMASALQQLVQVEITESERLARLSYQNLATLVTAASSSGTPAGELYSVVTTGPGVGGEAARAQLLTAYAALLQAMANVAPLATWVNKG
jgi:hypothetical protein